MRFWLLVLLAVAACDVLGVGPSYGVTPGMRTIVGKITEWQIPTPKYARDPSPGRDGNVYFAVMKGDKLARFDPKSERFNEWVLPEGTRPHGLVVAPDGKVVFGGSGNGTIGEFDPSTGKLREYKTSSAASYPYTLVLAADGNIWFTERKAGILGKLERASGKITEYPVGSDPYGLALDQQGNVWVSRMGADRVAKLDPKTGTVAELFLGTGSQPRRIAVAQDGMLWVALYGTGKLAKIDPLANRMVKAFDLPGGPNAGPYAVNVDGGGRIWVNEIQTDSVAVLDPHGETIRVIKLPSRNTGVRNAVIDADGRYWYAGSYSGKLGVIE